MAAPVSPCPVPEEQQPLNEYKDLAESWFYRWATLDRASYIKPIAWIWALSWLVVGPVVAYTFSPQKYPLQFGLGGAAAASLLSCLPLLQLYLGWGYVRDRLTQATIFYEESGWYDGQTWEKPLEVLTRDRLVVTHQIQPLLHRLKQTLIGIGAFLSLSTLACFIL